MGQLAWPGPKSVLKDVESCVILTRLFLRAHGVQENEEIPDMSWQMDHSAKPMIEPIPTRRRLMGQLAWPGPKNVLNDVESCVISTKLSLWAHEVQENEEIPDISWQMDHSAQPMMNNTT